MIMFLRHFYQNGVLMQQVVYLKNIEKISRFM